MEPPILELSLTDLKFREGLAILPNESDKKVG
jgi:hypothetical protein